MTELAVGDRLGEWTVVSQPNNTKWLMRCSCGTVKEVFRSNLLRGVSSSCYPCSVRGKLGSSNYAWRGTRGVPGRKWSRLVNGARSRGIAVEVDFDYVASLFTETCALSGLPIDKSSGSIDRINSTKGYIEGNIQWVHKDVNKMKNNLDQERFLELCKLITKENT